MLNRARENMQRILYFPWLASLFNDSVSLTLTDSVDIKVTAFSMPHIQTFRTANHRWLYKKNVTWRKNASDEQKGGENKLQKKGKRLMVIEGDQRERYKSAIPSLTFWQTLSKLNFRIWKKGAQCLRIPRLAPSLFMSATYGPPEPLSIYNRNLFARRVRQLEERLVFSRLLPRFSRNRGNCAETLDPRVRMRKRNGKKSRRKRHTSEVRLIALLSLTDSRTNYRSR